MDFQIGSHMEYTDYRYININKLITRLYILIKGTCTEIDFPYFNVNDLRIFVKVPHGIDITKTICYHCSTNR